MVEARQGAPSEQVVERHSKRLLNDVRKWFTTTELRQVSRHLAAAANQGAKVSAVLLARDTRTVCASDLFDGRNEHLVVSAPEGALAGALLRGCPRHEAFLFILMEHAVASRLDVPGATEFFPDLTIVGIAWSGEGSVTEHVTLLPLASQRKNARTSAPSEARRVILPATSVSDLRLDALLAPGVPLSEVVSLFAGEIRTQGEHRTRSSREKISRGILSKIGLTQEEILGSIEVAVGAATRSEARSMRALVLVMRISGTLRLFSGAAYQSLMEPRFSLSPTTIAISEVKLALQSRLPDELVARGHSDQSQLVAAIFSNAESFQLPDISELALLADQLRVAPVLSVSKGYEIGFLSTESWPKTRWKLI